MNKLTFFIFIFTIGFITTSCNDDDYSSDKYITKMATVVDMGSTFYFQLDNNEKLWVSAPQMAKPDADRVIINYTPLSDSLSGYDYTIRVNGIRKVLTKDIVYISPSNIIEQDSIGHDPIRMLTIWAGSDYLNIKFGFNYGEKQQHLVSLVADEPNFDVSASPIKIQFRHNQNNDPQLYPKEDYVCFDLKPYKKAALLAGLDKLEFQVQTLNFRNEEKTYSIEYKIVE